MRRLKLKANGIVYQVRPSFMMPYMIGETAEVEKGLYLLRWGVPFEALSYLFGRDPMYWYRAYVSLGIYSIVGTTIEEPSLLPSDVLADEKHTRRQGEKVYVTTTVAQECILGADIAAAADTEELTQGYRTFQQEAHQLDPDYAPDTVNACPAVSPTLHQLGYPSFRYLLIPHPEAYTNSASRRPPGQPMNTDGPLSLVRTFPFSTASGPPTSLPLDGVLLCNLYYTLRNPRSFLHLMVGSGISYFALPLPTFLLHSVHRICY
ncbi:MAG: hypothetical protein AAF702_09420 [Chloroflexota bacterium]